MISIGLIEDDDFMRDVYKKAIENDGAFKVVFSVDDVNELLAISYASQPDVILLDLMLPSGNSLHLIHKIKQLFPFTQVVILSSVVDNEITQLAMRNGAAGFLLKSSSIDFIKDALLKTFEGGVPLSPIIVNNLLQVKVKPTIGQAYPTLTNREIELISLLKTGMSNKVAADTLNITFFTINHHLKSIYAKLNISSKSELIATAMRFVTAPVGLD